MYSVTMEFALVIVLLAGRILLKKQNHNSNTNHNNNAPYGIVKVKGTKLKKPTHETVT